MGAEHLGDHSVHLLEALLCAAANSGFQRENVYKDHPCLVLLDDVIQSGVLVFPPHYGLLNNLMLSVAIPRHILINVFKVYIQEFFQPQ